MKSSECRGANDPFNLERFVSAQERVTDVALSELQRGRKASHWMWFIFQQLAGLGTSAAARQYAIRNLDEARAYLEHPVLGPRLLACCRAILSVPGKSASDLMGYPDDLKLRSSLTLFSLVGGAAPEFQQALDKFFAGYPDPRTLELLKLR